MKYRRLGRTGLAVSVVGVGTWQLSGEWGQTFTQREVDQLFGRARELGVNLIDSAECYGDHLAEALIGAAIRHRRDDWVIATKFGHQFHPEAMGQDRWSPVTVRSDHWTPQEVIGQLEASLRALGTDHVDLYQAHSAPAAVIDHDDLWEALHRQVARGTVRHLGLSVSGGDLDQARRAGQLGAGVFQVCGDQGLGVMVREPLANGYLSGKYRPGAGITGASDWRSAGDPVEAQRRLEVVEEIRRTEVPHGMAMAQWAIAWCLQHPAVSCVVAGARSVEQVQSSAAAADLELIREDHPQAVVP